MNNPKIIQLPETTQVVVSALQTKLNICQLEVSKIIAAFNESIAPFIPGDDKSGYQLDSKDGILFLSLIENNPPENKQSTDNTVKFPNQNQ